MNVLKDRWIPVIRIDGTREKIDPSQITSKPRNPIIAIDCGRPDFNAYMVRFLIGLSNTYLAPKNKKQWKEQFHTPPKQKEISNKLRPEHFNFDGNGSRFLQDKKPKELEKTINIGSLLFETPGEKTIKDGKDFFQKKKDHVFCQTCATIALYLRQSTAIMAGAGYRTSITSGTNGSLTTFITKETLWETIWSNVIVKTDMYELGGDPRKAMLPWLSDTVDSRNKDTIFLRKKHPYYPLWEMPLRIHLIFERSNETCTICGSQNSVMIHKYKTKNYGNCYEDPRHIFSPFMNQQKDKEITFRKPILYATYSDLVTYLLPTDKLSPAHVINHFIANRNILEDSDHLNLWTFGYHTDKAKLYGWEENTFPLSDLLFKDHEFTLKISHSSYQIGWYICSHIRQMWDTEKNDPFILNEFFLETEEDFYKVLRDNDVKSWLESMVIKAITLFEKHVGNDRRGLQKYFNEQYINIINKKVVEPLGIDPLDYYDFIHLEYQKQDLPYLEKEFMVPFLSWFGTVNTSIKKRTFTRTHSVEDLIQEDIFIDFIDKMSKHLPDLTEDYTKNLFAAALLISFRAKSIDFSQPFPVQIATMGLSLHDLDQIMKYDRDEIISYWKTFANIVDRLDGFNISSFLNGYIHWDKDVKAYWNKEYLKNS